MSFIAKPSALTRIWFNPATRHYTAIPNHPGDMPEGTLRAVLKQAGVEVDVFLKM
ncbi:MAG: type II toxin-antitoxin system HicA family toxin [Chromatiales bacterium]